jgi:hypothetical protein
MLSKTTTRSRKDALNSKFDEQSTAQEKQKETQSDKERNGWRAAKTAAYFF